MRHILTLIGACTLLAACASPDASAPPLALAELQPTRGSTVNGEVRFLRKQDTLMLAGEVRGLAPNSEHGFHIHEKGDCSSGDGLSAGGHFNPDGHRHGASASSAEMHHAGDLPSLHADAAGVARFSFPLPDVAVGQGPHDILGRAFIVHRDADDYASQPAGNSGPRLACGVIHQP